MAFDSKVQTYGDQSPAVSAEGDVTVNYGLTPEQVLELTKAAAAGAVEPLTDKIIDLSQKLGVTQGAALSMLRDLGHDDVPVERLPDMLVAAATQIRAMHQALGRQTNNREIAGLRRQAVMALDEGAFDRATNLLNDIRVKERAASEQRRRRAEEAHASWIAGLQSEAETCTLLARAALSRRDVTGAVTQFEEGLLLLAPVDLATRWSYALNAAAALYNFGGLAGRNDALAASVDVYRRALADATRERVPLDWAMTQNNLGNALLRLGERKSDTAHLEQAVTAYRAALQEWTREHVPLNWALTQNNLGNALLRLGERESGTARLEQAVIALRDALQECTRERIPLHWALTQNSLGTALSMLGERESGTARLEQAVTAYRAALEERTRERVPLDWALTQNDLGNALLRLGEREGCTAHLEQAMAAYRAALEERTRERVPLDWAMTQNNLGAALQTLGERESDTAHLEQAVDAYHAALQEWTRERVPRNWALNQNNLGNALLRLGERESGTARLEQAMTAYDAALAIFIPAGADHYIKVCQANKNKVAMLLRKKQ